ncbi:hypothetical protein ATY81_15895 [Rhizobium sp. R72]|nr:hypothetical protein ATY81_15895 [Rhizobium sp. R72]OWV92866.1 hypothetical protein ATY80_15895 [Rhizobium sp. R711]
MSDRAPAGNVFSRARSFTKCSNLLLELIGGPLYRRLQISGYLNENLQYFLNIGKHGAGMARYCFALPNIISPTTDARTSTSPFSSVNVGICILALLHNGKRA